MQLLRSQECTGQTTGSKSFRASYVSLSLSQLPYWQRFAAALDDWCLVFSCISNIILVGTLTTAVHADPDRGISTSDLLRESLRWLASQWVLGFAALAWRKVQPCSYLKWRTYALAVQRGCRLVWFHTIASFLRDDVSSGCFKLARQRAQSATSHLAFLRPNYNLFRIVLLTSFALPPLSHTLQAPLPPLPNLAILATNSAITLHTLFWPTVHALASLQLPFRDLCDFTNYAMRLIERAICCVPQDPDFFNNTCSSNPLLPLVTFVYLYFSLALPLLASRRIQSYIDHLASSALPPIASEPPPPPSSSLQPTGCTPEHAPATAPDTLDMQPPRPVHAKPQLGSPSPLLVLEHIVWNLLVAAALAPALWVMAMHLHPYVAFRWSRQAQQWPPSARTCH